MLVLLGAFTGARGLGRGYNARAVVTVRVAMEAAGMVSAKIILFYYDEIRLYFDST